MLGLITGNHTAWLPAYHIINTPAIGPKLHVSLISTGLTLTHDTLQAEVTQIVAITLKYCKML